MCSSFTFGTQNIALALKTTNPLLGDDLVVTPDVGEGCEQESHGHHLLPSAGQGTGLFLVPRLP